MPIVVKGVFPVVYRQTGKVCYTLTDPTTVQLHGEITDEFMGAFRVETDMDGVRYQVLSVDLEDGELCLESLEDGTNIYVRETGPQTRRGEPGLRVSDGVLYG